MRSASKTQETFYHVNAGDACVKLSVLKFKSAQE